MCVYLMNVTKAVSLSLSLSIIQKDVSFLDSFRVHAKKNEAVTHCVIQVKKEVSRERQECVYINLLAIHSYHHHEGGDCVYMNLRVMHSYHYHQCSHSCQASIHLRLVHLSVHFRGGVDP